MTDVFKRVSAYADDEMNLPVKDVTSAVPFYENVMGFSCRVKARHALQNRGSEQGRSEDRARREWR